MEVGCAGDYDEPVDEAVVGQYPDQINENNVTESMVSTEDQLLRCRLERLEDEEIRKLEEDRLQEIIRLCQSYNDAQEGKRVRSLRVNEVDRLLELMKPDFIQSTTVDNGSRFPLVTSKETANGNIGLDCSTVKDLPQQVDRNQSNTLLDAKDIEFHYNSYNDREQLTDDSANGSVVKASDNEAEENGLGDDNDDNANGCAKLTALSIEKSLIRGEIDDMKHQQFSDAEDEELKEFQRIEKEIKLTELYKCLETIEKEIIAIKQQQLLQQLEQQEVSSSSPEDGLFCKNSQEKVKDTLDGGCAVGGGGESSGREAPLASCESDESTSSDEEISLGEKVKSADFTRIVSQHQQKQHLDDYHTYSSIYSETSFHDSPNDQMDQITSRRGESVKDIINNLPRLRRETQDPENTEGVKERQQRPLTIYLPSTAYDLDLVDHIVNFGHDVGTFSHLVQLTPTSCSGYLWKLCSNTENQWRKRYFLFDRQNKVFVYFKSFKSFVKAKKAKYGVYFNQIEDAYVDHNRTKLEKKVNPLSGSLRRRSNSTRHVFVVVTSERNFTLSSFVPEVMRIWIDVIFTGAEGYLNFES